MRTSNDQTMRGDYPFMRMPKQKAATSDFKEMCDDLKGCILRANSFFMWYGSITKSRDDEIRSILFLECLLLQILVNIRKIFMMRGKTLCNECTDTFKDLLIELNNEMRKGTKFIRLSNQCLWTELHSENPCVVSMRQDVITGFRELSGWLREEARKPANRERAEALADELGLNYDMKLFVCTGDSFGQHTCMVINGLILLSLPSMPSTQTDEFCELFDNSIAELQASKSWKWAFDSWRRKIQKEYDLNDIVEDKDKVVYLKKIWIALDRQEQELLECFNIMADSTRSPKEKATMGFRIYDHLNAAPLDSSPRMSMDELQQYLLYVVQKQWLDDEIERLKATHFVKEQPNPLMKKRKMRHLFKQDVDQSLLKECLNEVYCRFFVNAEEERESLTGAYKDLMALMAYLYIICEDEGYFENADKVPFFKFCVEELQFPVTKGDRTFRNRYEQVEIVYKNFRLNGPIKPKKGTENDFQKVLRIFHGTKFYWKLKKKMFG